MRKPNIVVAALAVLAGLPYATASAQAWPAKPVKVIVPYAAGGVVDVQTRNVTTRMAADLGQPFIVEARPGANANIGAEAVARAPADGYTLLVTAPFLINNPLLEADLRWKPADFAPVARFTLSPSFVLVPASSPANSVKEYVALARAKPGLQFGDGGTGSTQSVATLILAAVADIKIEPVLYKGAPPIIPDLINGLISMSIIPSTVALPPVKSGKLRALANTSDRRSPLLPDVPTIAEAGFPEATVMSWYGFHVPAGTPREVVRRASDATRTATGAAETRERAANAGGEIAFLATEEFEKFLRADAERWERAVRIIRK